MINLLPRENQAQNKSDYLQKLFLVAGSLLFVLILISAILLAPSYFSLLLEKRSFSEDLISIGDEGFRKDLRDTDKVIGDLNFQIDSYKRNKRKILSLTSLMAEVLKSVPDNVKILTIDYSREKTRKKEIIDKIFIEGESGNRQSFRQFEEKLKEVSQFKNVLSPVDNLLRENDIEFTLTIEL